MTRLSEFPKEFQSLLIEGVLGNQGTLLSEMAGTFGTIYTLASVGWAKARRAVPTPEAE